MATIEANGKRVEVEPVDFEVIKDSWQILQLADGVRLRVKAIVVDVARNTAADAATDDAYFVKAQLLIIPEPPADETPPKETSNA